MLDDVRDVNLSYLLLMQRLINSDRELAMFRLKIDEEMADLLSKIPVPDLVKLARCNQLLCHFSLGDASELYSLVNASEDDDMRRVHAAILLSSQDKREGQRRQGERRQGDRRQADRRTQAAGDWSGPERRRSDRRQAERRTGKDRRQADRRAGPPDSK
ncbi:transcriptional activator FlhD [Salinisphaera sp. T31B1]